MLTLVSIFPYTRKRLRRQFSAIPSPREVYFPFGRTYNLFAFQKDFFYNLQKRRGCKKLSFFTSSYYIAANYAVRSLLFMYNSAFTFGVNSEKASEKLNKLINKLTYGIIMMADTTTLT